MKYSSLIKILEDDFNCVCIEILKHNNGYIAWIIENSDAMDFPLSGHPDAPVSRAIVKELCDALRLPEAMFPD